MPLCPRSSGVRIQRSSSGPARSAASLKPEGVAVEDDLREALAMPTNISVEKVKELIRLNGRTPARPDGPAIRSGADLPVRKR